MNDADSEAVSYTEHTQIDERESLNAGRDLFSFCPYMDEFLRVRCDFKLVFSAVVCSYELLDISVYSG